MISPDYALYLITTGLGAAAFSYYLYKLYSNILKIIKLKNGATCKGNITRKRTDLDENTLYFVTYVFNDHLGKRHKEQIQITKKYFNTLSKGQEIKIIYQHDNPKNSYPMGKYARTFLWRDTFFLFLMSVGISILIYKVIDN